MAAVGRVTKVELLLNGTYKCEKDSIVLDTCCSDVILGREWLYRHQPTIDWQTGKVKVVNSEFVQEPRMSTNTIQCSEISAQQAKKLIVKEGSEVYLAFLKAMDDAKEENTETPVAKDAKLQKLLSDYSDVFPSRLPGLPPIRGTEHEIKLSDDKPVFRPTYRLSPLELRTLKDQITEMLELKLIQPCASPYGAPILFVKKSDGSLRMVIDFRALNKKVVRDRYPMPLISDLLDKLSSATIMSKLDLLSGFYQVRVADNSRGLTVITTPMGQFELLGMPMGQANSTATMQRTMDTILGGLEGLLYYLDDLLVFGSDAQEHYLRLEEVLKRMRNAKLYAKLTKCEFGVKELVWLGHKIGNGVRTIDPRKASEIKSYPRPKSATEVRAFVGVINYCRDYLPKLSQVLSPLTELTKKNVKFDWKDEHEVAFERAKKLIGEALELAMYDEEKSTKLQTDASMVGLGAVLLQKSADDKWIPVAVASRKLNSAEQNYPTH